MRARVWWLALLASASCSGLALLASASCSGEESKAPPVTTTGPTDTLVIAVQQDLRDQLSVLAQSAQDVQVIDQTNVGLFDGDFDCKVTYHPMLAKSWSFSADGLALDVQLRDDLTWYDGTPVTARSEEHTSELQSQR